MMPLPTADDEWELPRLPSGLRLTASLSLSRHKFRPDKFRWCILIHDETGAMWMEWFGMPPMHKDAADAFEDARTILRNLGFYQRRNGA